MGKAGNLLKKAAIMMLMPILIFALLICVIITSIGALFGRNDDSETIDLTEIMVNNHSIPDGDYDDDDIVWIKKGKKEIQDFLKNEDVKKYFSTDSDATENERTRVRRAKTMAVTVMFNAWTLNNKSISSYSLTPSTWDWVDYAKCFTGAYDFNADGYDVKKDSDLVQNLPLYCNVTLTDDQLDDAAESAKEMYKRIKIDKQVDLIDVVALGNGITSEYEGEGYEWVPSAQKEIKDFQADEQVQSYFTADSNASDDARKAIRIRKAKAIGLLYSWWVENQKSIKPDGAGSDFWIKYAKAFTKTDISDDGYNYLTDKSFDKVEDACGIKISDELRSNAANNAEIIYNRIGADHYSGDGTVVGNAIAWAENAAEDDSHGYSQATRWGNPDYDCSGLTISAYKEQGVNVGGATYTGNMCDAMRNTGNFAVYDFTSMQNLQPGDILVVHNGDKQHTEMYIGDGKNVGAHISETGGVYGQAGDQTDDHNPATCNGEVSITPFYNDTWMWVIRYTGS